MIVVLVWGLPRDPPTASVYAALCRQGHAVALLDQRTTVAAEADMLVNGRVALSVRTRDGDIDLERFTAAYVRPYDVRELPAVRRAGVGSATWERAVCVDQMLTDWADLAEACVVNRPAAMTPNSSKPFQSRLLREAGFAVPDTMITTDPDAVRAFREQHRRVVYKSISGIRSIVSELTDEQMGRVDDVRWCPTQFQQLVCGVDHRVHVAGEEVFAARIESDAIDYRYAEQQGCTATIRPTHLPADVAARCVEVTRGMGLAFAGIDLKRTAEGQWYCFEVNPSPGFTYYQNATGQPIDEAVARLLASHVHG